MPPRDREPPPPATTVHTGGAALRARLARPDRPLRLLQAHDGLSARVAATAVGGPEGAPRRFDGLWIGSLADSATRAQPDEEMIDLGSRLDSLAWTLEATDLPAVFDADTGGWPQQAAVLVRRLARLGVAGVVFEDKAGRKRNSLETHRHEQTGASTESFCAKLRAAVAARPATNPAMNPATGPMIVARIESLIRGDSADDALTRAHAYVEAGADALLIHGAGPDAEPVLGVVRACRAQSITVPIFVVPTAYPTTHEQQLADAGVDVVVYANQLLRAALATMQATARTLLHEGRAAAVDPSCVPVAELLRFIDPR
ncbi:MAG: isocitrate lyase/phosphoenolpyruvate mutase family protein [Myxococcota bacterium]